MSAFRVLTSVGLARSAILETNHAAIETPVFMPVGTQGAVKALLARDLEEMGAQIVLGNAYHLYLRPGDVLVKEMGGIQRFAGWDGAVLTDSGGYQIFSLGLLRKIQEEGVTFQSHIDGSKHFLTPERVVEIQENLMSDICMCLDECVSYPSSHDYTKASMGLTTRWARRCRDAKKSGSLLFGIVQGGMYGDLRLQSARDLVALDFAGYALGGFSVGEPKGVMWEMVDAVMGELPSEKPRYLMGLGFPEDIVEGVRKGIDMFDCVIPTRHARNGNLFTRAGRINIKHARYAHDETPLDETCGCYTCGRFSKAYLRHLFVTRELTSYYLNTLHNVSFYLGLMKRIREEIRQERFEAFYNEFMSEWKGGEV
ncbi:MAG: tRNA guanosine(34) transglycosylase Tgt [Syntrophorhabdales bacterium]|jgi:queuine tRNA-ribosyltransferase